MLELVYEKTFDSREAFFLLEDRKASNPLASLFTGVRKVRDMGTPMFLCIDNHDGDHFAPSRQPSLEKNDTPDHASRRRSTAKKAFQFLHLIATSQTSDVCPNVLSNKRVVSSYNHVDPMK